jgi:hypothetical protein
MGTSNPGGYKPVAMERREEGACSKPQQKEEFSGYLPQGSFNGRRLTTPPHMEPHMEKFYDPLPEGRRYSLQEPDGPPMSIIADISGKRESSSESKYNEADLVHIKYRRKYLFRIMIEYGAYIAIVAVVYFLLVGIPLWKGAIHWLYCIMKHKLIFSGGWVGFITIQAM